MISKLVEKYDAQAYNTQGSYVIKYVINSYHHVVFGIMEKRHLAAGQTKHVYVVAAG